MQLSAVHEAEQIGVGEGEVPPADGVLRYLPAAQAAHDIAPVVEPLSVMEPAGQAVQLAAVHEAVQIGVGVEGVPPADGVAR